MINGTMDFLEKVVNGLGITRVLREASQQKQIAERPYCHLIPQKGTITKDWTKVRRDVYDPPDEPGYITQFLRKWIVNNPIRVVFVAGKDCERYGYKFLASLPKGFTVGGQWVTLTVTSEIPPLDESLLYDAGEIAYDVTFTSGVYAPIKMPMFKDSIVKGEILYGSETDSTDSTDRTA